MTETPPAESDDLRLRTSPPLSVWILALATVTMAVAALVPLSKTGPIVGRGYILIGVPAALAASAMFAIFASGRIGRAWIATLIAGACESGVLAWYWVDHLPEPDDRYTLSLTFEPGLGLYLGIGSGVVMAVYSLIAAAQSDGAWKRR